MGLGSAGCSILRAPAADAYTVRVAGGALDRRGVVAQVSVPQSLKGLPLRLTDAEGRAAPMQLSPEGDVWFIVDSLAHGSAAVFTLAPGEPAPEAEASLTATEQNGVVRIEAGGQPVLQFNARETPPPPGVRPIFARGAYIHPVYTPSGLWVTDDYPPNHLHHHGIWAAWTKTVFEGRRPDFWNVGDSTGRVAPVALDTVWSGPVHAGFRSRQQYIDVSASPAKVALDETWEVRVYPPGEGGRYYVFDLVQVQQASTQSPLELPTYHYGGVGFRGNRAWDGAANAVFLTSEGKTRADGHATTARWCHIGGRVGGGPLGASDAALAGITIMNHPGNFRAPQPMRIHPTEPFFNYAPSQGGPWSIRPGERYVARYRFVVYDGEPDVALLERLYGEFANPPVVSVSGR